MGRVADWVSDETLEAVEAALKSPADRLALRVSRHTGLRIGDVLALEARQLERQRISVREAKTGKRRQVYLPRGLWQALRDISGRTWVFDGLTPLRHRSYDALWLDLRQAVRSVGLREAVSAHSWRKGYAVAKYRETGSIEAVRRLMGHDSETVTMLYALADVLTRDRLSPQGGRTGTPPERPPGERAPERHKKRHPAAPRHDNAGGSPPGQDRPDPARPPAERPNKAIALAQGAANTATTRPSHQPPAASSEMKRCRRDKQQKHPQRHDAHPSGRRK